MSGSNLRILMAVLTIVLALPMLSGCDSLKGDDGRAGPAGPAGAAGVAGPAGAAGQAGADGTPCTVTDNSDGTFTQSCPGGDSVTFGETDEPDAYAAADGVRGGQLYDKWWVVTGDVAPTTTHALYPSFGAKSGADTWRCKECHGWDYIGKDGRYRSGSHYTGIEGLYPGGESVWIVYKTIRDGHGYGAAGLSDADVWDLVKFYREELIDIYYVLNRDGTFTGTAVPDGQTLYDTGISGWNDTGRVTNFSCSACHGADGLSPVVTGFDTWPGFLANDNPQEFQHKVRFGHPGSNMPKAAAIHASLWDIADLSAYCQTLPQVAP